MKKHTILLSIVVCLVAMLCIPAAKASEARRTFYTYDARALNGLDLRERTNAVQVWDTMHLLAALQGLANRKEPRLYILYCREFGVDTDQFWLDWFRGEDGWLSRADFVPLGSIEQAVSMLRDVFRGLVVYDPLVPATSIVASTVAGCDDLLPVRYDPSPGSLYNRLTRDLRLPVRVWLLNSDGTSTFKGKGVLPGSPEPSSGSAKIDAYRWALARYLHAGKCEPGYGAYYVDAFWMEHPTQAGPAMHTLSNHDYFIAHKAFFFDLSPWGDEPPNDDPVQRTGSDKECLLRVLRGLYDACGGGIIKIGGFPPWPFKYTAHSKPSGKHEGVPTEWEFTRLISQFNCYKEADAAGPGAIANSSFAQHYPLSARYGQPNRKPTKADWRRRGFIDPQGRVAPRFFVGHYVGDYDAPSWLYKAVPAFFKDPARGKVPLGWAFDPNLSDRAPQALVYAYRHATTNDFFIAGDSGAGYLNPRGLTARPDSSLLSGLSAWTEHCRKYYLRWDMTITGFILDGAAGASTETEFASYGTFSPDGAGTHFENGPALHTGLATCPERDLPDDASHAAEVIVSQARKAGQEQPGFLWARSILKSPGWYAEVSRILRNKYPELPIEVVDPYTFFGLVQTYCQGRSK